MNDAPFIVAAVTEWFRAHARPFPWRDEKCSPWGVLVSEVMSQQTQMSRVEPRWRAFMARWPTPAALAASTDAEVIRMWDRLGYPRRAVALRRCATAIVEEHGGEVPASVDALLALPGIGPYTAGAVASFAYAQALPVVDTNIRRVLARAIDGEALAWTANPRRDEREARSLLPADGREGKLWNAGVMELGALICTARAPRCPECPIKDWCQWRGAGFPASSAAPRRKQARFEGSDRQRRGRVLAALRAHPGGLALDDLAASIGLVDAIEIDRHLEITKGLVADGLIIRHESRIALPGELAEVYPSASSSSSRR